MIKKDHKNVLIKSLSKVFDVTNLILNKTFTILLFFMKQAQNSVIAKTSTSLMFEK